MTVISKHPFLAALVFITAYFTTISIKAQAQDTVVSGDAIQLQDGDLAMVTGTITNTNSNYFDMDSNGKTMRVYLTDMDLKTRAEDVFAEGMNVTVRGDFRGEQFGRTIVRADNVVASTGPTTTIMQDGAANY